MNLRSPREKPSMPLYDPFSDPHLKSYHRPEGGFARHWGTMKSKIRPMTGVELLVEAKSKTRVSSASHALPAIAKNPRRAVTANTERRRRKLPRRRPDSPIAAKRSSYLAGMEQFTEFDALFFETPSDGSSGVGSSFKPSRVETPDDGDDSSSLAPLIQLYASTIEKEEDYLRRQTLTEEMRERTQRYELYCRTIDEQKMREQQCGAAYRSEKKARELIAAEEAEARAILKETSERSIQGALTRQEVFPQCPLLDVGESKELPMASSSAFTAELRWVGNVQLQLVVIAFRGQHEHVANAAISDILRTGGPRGQIVVRPWGSFTHVPVGNITKTSVEFMLQHLPNAREYSRFVLAAFCYSRVGNVLSEADRCYLTIRTPPKASERVSPTHRTQETVAVKIGCADTRCFVIGSIEATAASMAASANKPTWSFRAHRMKVDVVSHQRLPEFLRGSFLKSVDETMEDFVTGRHKIEAYDFHFWQDLDRKRVAAMEEDSRAALQQLMMKAPSPPRRTPQSISFAPTSSLKASTPVRGSAAPQFTRWKHTSK